MRSYALMAVMGEVPHEAEARGLGREDEVIRAASGDRAALARVLSELAPPVLAAARRVLGHTAPRGRDAQDVTQETLIAVARHLPELRHPGRLLAYARRTAVRRALRLRRDAVREHDRLAALARTDELRGDLRDDARSRGHAELLLALLDTLSEEQAETMLLRFALGMSLAEVSQATDVPTNTVRSRIRLAKERMRSELERHPTLRAALEAP
jgi:RNA polymerase sigma-70 factor (ECF subfamily)